MGLILLSLSHVIIYGHRQIYRKEIEDDEIVDIFAPWSNFVFRGLQENLHVKNLCMYPKTYMPLDKEEHNPPASKLSEPHF